MEEGNRFFLHTPMEAEDIHSLWHQKLLEMPLFSGGTKFPTNEGENVPLFFSETGLEKLTATSDENRVKV